MFIRKGSENIRFDALKWQVKRFFQKGLWGIKIISKWQRTTYYVAKYFCDEIKELKRRSLVLNSKSKELKRFFIIKN
jgi:hypothetical protein